MNVAVLRLEREEEAEIWARERLGLLTAPDFFRTVSLVDSSGQFKVVVVLTNFTSRNVDLNVAVDAPVPPRGAMKLFNETFSFIFDSLKLVRATGLVQGKNDAAKAFIQGMGFQLEGVMRKAFPDDDLFIYALLEEQYRSHPWYRRRST